MDNNRLIELIKYPETCSADEREELLKLCREYPYSAVLKIISAKIASIDQTPEFNKYITTAAIATVDRGNFQHYLRSDDWEVSGLTSDQIHKLEPEMGVPSPTDIAEETTVEESEKITSPEKTESKDTTGSGEKIPPVKTEKKKDSGIEAEIAETKESPEKEGVTGKDEIKSAAEISNLKKTETPPPESASETKKQEEEEKKRKAETGKEEFEETDRKKKGTDRAEIPESGEYSQKLKGKKKKKSGIPKEPPADLKDESPDKSREKISKRKKRSETPEEIGKEPMDSISPDQEEMERSGKQEPPGEPPSVKKEPDKAKDEKQSPEPENKQPPSEKITDEEESGPLASDLLRNIQEYRKKREFFEKFLDSSNQSEAESKPESGRDLSNKTGPEKEESKFRKPKKDKKKKSKPGNLSEEEKTDQNLKEPTDDRKVKKNSREKDRTNKDELEDISDQSVSPLDKTYDGKTATGDTHGEKDTASGERRKEDENTILRPDGENQIPSEIPDEDTIEKVTEEQKSEGYRVDEEEDPDVIKNFLENITQNSEKTPPPKKLKKEEQEEIIERFIKSEPKIKNVKSAQTLREREDLSATSVKFKDDIISENLANIMKSQGKTEEAIDIYKKLIWKFPQKKTYFAAQIEELKRKLGK